MVRNLRVLMVQDFSDMLGDPCAAPCCCEAQTYSFRGAHSCVAVSGAVACLGHAMLHRRPVLGDPSPGRSHLMHEASDSQKVQEGELCANMADLLTGTSLHWYVSCM